MPQGDDIILHDEVEMPCFSLKLSELSEEETQIEIS